ncbi:universal stress protein [Aurantibacillus circumpalustris]|uniref:universal stress protein n=1 Tax=Aurantibacillus circumpalustris TaxID=3036359 RepID=UPI00295BF883|nr:universal stress protein [Aurantibacillus circumpalustris]
MKTIIAGTDFSSSSQNACRYAALLALKLNCKLTVFNLFQAPVLHSNSGLYGISYLSVKKTSEKQMEEFVSKLVKNFPSLKINAFTTSGAFEEELEVFIARHQVQAVVMGLQTKNRISKFIYGSHGVKLAGKIEAPVIIVPESYKDHRLETLLLAVDNAEKLSNSPLKILETFAKNTQSQVKLLHVRTPDEVLNPRESSFVKINKSQIKVEVMKSKTIENGIKNFCREREADLVAIISKKHSVLYNLFNESTTKRVSFAAHIPVLAIHE